MKLKDFNFLFALVALALFDALFGGALAAILQHEGWKQRINDIWQVGFGMICALTIIILAFSADLVQAVINFHAQPIVWNLHERFSNALKTLQDARYQAIYLIAMLLAFAEDLLFYPALWLLNDIGVTSLISGGYEYDFPRFLWPWSMSGWFGFLTRLIWGETIKLPTVTAMLLAIGTLAGIVWHIQYRKDKS